MEDNRNVGSQEDIEKRINALAEEKVKAIREKDHLENERKALETQKEQLRQWENQLRETQDLMQNAQRSSQRAVRQTSQDNPKEENFLLNRKQQEELYRDLQQRNYEQQVSNFKTLVKTHVSDNSDALANLSKLTDDQVFRAVIQKIHHHKEATGQDLSTADAAKEAEREIHEMVQNLAGEKLQEKTVENLEDRGRLMEDEIKETQSLSQSLEEKGSDERKLDPEGPHESGTDQMIKDTFKDILNKS